MQGSEQLLGLVGQNISFEIQAEYKYMNLKTKMMTTLD